MLTVKIHKPLILLHLIDMIKEVPINKTVSLRQGGTSSLDSEAGK